jgi:tRNA(Ile)-lysidine synthase
MQIAIKPGKYVVAVSGGVDSTVLLDLLRLHPGLKLIVAHYDHGIREDSEQDKAFVEVLARRWGLPFVYDRGHLGAEASEAAARQARYGFLQKVRVGSGYDAIITAHHQDDVLETALINLLRGTGRKGLSSLKSTDGIIRPLLHAPKSEIIDYARRHGLPWREDSTNRDTKYLRNHIRHNVLPRFDATQRAQLVEVAARMHEINGELDDLLRQQVQPELGREWFILLPHDIAREVMAAWLRLHDIRDFDRKTVERLTVAAKVAHPGKIVDVTRGHAMQVGKQHLALKPRER